MFIRCHHDSPFRRFCDTVPFVPWIRDLTGLKSYLLIPDTNNWNSELPKSRRQLCYHEYIDLYFTKLLNIRQLLFMKFTSTAESVYRRKRNRVALVLLSRSTKILLVTKNLFNDFLVSKKKLMLRLPNTRESSLYVCCKPEYCSSAIINLFLDTDHDTFVRCPSAVFR
jgi:hypothetical protein